MRGDRLRQRGQGVDLRGIEQFAADLHAVSACACDDRQYGLLAAEGFDFVVTVSRGDDDNFSLH